MSTFSHQGHALAYEVFGEGPRTVMALPGMGDLRSQYRLMVPGLVAAGYRVVTVDPRGHGESDAWGTVTPELVGADLVALIDHLGLEEVVIAGNSAGGASAVWAAAEVPQKVVGLLLIGAIVRDPQPMAPWLMAIVRAVFLPFWGAWAWGQFYRTLYKGGTPADHEAHIAKVVEGQRSRERREANLGYGMSTKGVCAARIGEVKAPSLLIIGDRDPDFPDPVAETRAVGALLGARVEILEGVGHYPHLERPEATTALSLAFLEEVPWRGQG